MNKTILRDRDWFFVMHTLDEEMYSKVIDVFIKEGFNPTPLEYDPFRSITIRMV